MEQSLYQRNFPREQIRFNVLLINEMGMQRGCRVIDVSQGGMLLRWSVRKDDFREVSKYIHFDPGMFVHVFFILGVKSKKETFSISAKVVRSTDNGIAVEFHQPQPRLLELLVSPESVSIQAETGDAEGEPINIGAVDGTNKKINIMYLMAFLAGVLTTTAVMAAVDAYKHYMLTKSGDITSTTVTIMDSRLPERDLNVYKAEIQNPDYADSHKSMPISMEKTTSKNTVEFSFKETASDNSVEQSEIDEKEILSDTDAGAVINLKDKKVENSDVEWIINLLTLSNKQSADEMTNKAHSLGFPVVQEKVDVNGQSVWRLRLFGFDRKSDAEEYAANIKQQLNIDKVWIMNQPRVMN